MLAPQVYEQDDDNDEDELKDTLVRIAKLSMPFSATDADTSSEISLFDVLAFLTDSQAVSKSALRIVLWCARLCHPITPSASLLQAKRL